MSGRILKTYSLFDAISDLSSTQDNLCKYWSQVILTFFFSWIYSCFRICPVLFCKAPIISGYDTCLLHPRICPWLPPSLSFKTKSISGTRKLWLELHSWDKCIFWPVPIWQVKIGPWTSLCPARCFFSVHWEPFFYTDAGASRWWSPSVPTAKFPVAMWVSLKTK